MLTDAMLAQLPQWWAGFLLCFARIGSFILLLPMLGDEAVPPRIRLTAALAMVLMLAALVRPAVPEIVIGDPHWLALILTETITGIALAMLVRMMFMAAAMAGAIASAQIGLTAAMAYDPASGGQSPLLARLIGLGALVACFAAGLHHHWIAAVLDSYRLFPPGQLPPAEDLSAMLVQVAGGSLALAVSLCAPLIAYGLLLQLTLGIAARLAPGIQIFFIAQPAQIAIGLAMLATLLGAMIAGFTGAMADWQSGMGW